MLAYRKSYFWASIWDFEFQQMHIQGFGESQFDNAYFILGLLLKYDCLQKIIFGASVWDSGFQRMHKQMFDEIQFYNAVYSGFC